MDYPGRLYVAATFLPLASFVILLLAGALRAAARPLRNTPLGRSIFDALGGDIPGRTGAYIATSAIGLAFICSLVGFIFFLSDHERGHGPLAHAAVAEHGTAGAEPDHSSATEARWSENVVWAKLGFADKPATTLTLGYRIDSLTAVMFLMVTFIATLIHVFSIGYMNEELQPIVEDHQVHTAEGHFHRRGRYGRFFLFLSLFCFSMLNLVLADNLFQVFLSWELVGICSYLLIGFYYERQSASNAANKAFITNRIGDAGFIIGLLILWTYVGTFNFQELFHEIPQRLLDGSLPHWLLVTAGLGIFLGCVGKSAQFPLHVWLPDAMEGPTPVSALIHAATMVAAGVYLVGRVYPLFTLEARLVIAYTGGITLFVAATIAVVMTDIKKVLAYSTVSQLGYMMLALGIGGWVAGLFHLLTHAFFKALLFLCSGSVIYGCHHEQEMTKMGGLYPKMKITALTMLMGVLAIAGTPLFSGWYSKDMILAHALGYCAVNPQHSLLLILPLVTAAITTFYMFRMWFMTFTGSPRDEHVYEHAHESPRWMTVPLILLSIGSVTVAWGLPLQQEFHSSDFVGKVTEWFSGLYKNTWDPEGSFIGGQEGLLTMSEPKAAISQMALAQRTFQLTSSEEHQAADAMHSMAEVLALAAAAIGILFAYLLYYAKVLKPEEAKKQFPAVHRFLWHKWYFDELYSGVLVRPALVVAGWCRSFDLSFIDGFVNGLGRFTVRLANWDGKFDLGVIDGLANLIARVAYALGGWFRKLQTGFIRSYVLFLVLAALGIFFVISYLVAVAAG
jgi:NADH-quinone oxidoreductase subunit L